jgi:hypothetical protein
MYILQVLADLGDKPLSCCEHGDIRMAQNIGSVLTS